MKKLLALVLALVFVVSLASCRGAEAPVEPTDEPETSTTPGEDTDSTTTDETVAPAGDYKIAIVTGTVSQGEEEYQAALQMIEKYGKDRIVTATYPDNFTAEAQTTIANMSQFAEDPDVKAIILLQAVPGTMAAIDKIRETRDDILIIAGIVAEPPLDITSKADLVVNVDDIGSGYIIPVQAQKQGAEVIVHYSFPRHLGYEHIALRRDIMKEESERLGLEFIEVTAPDPTGDAGVAGTQQFIMEDVPRQVEKYGKNVSFYSTNCAMQEPMIKSVAEQGAIMTQQCCPSPYHGYPGAFGIEVPEDKAGDVDFILEKTKAAVDAAGNSGRMSTWSIPVNMLLIEASTDYAVGYLEGTIEGKANKEAFEKIANEVAPCTVDVWDSEATGELDNYLLVTGDYYDF